MRERGGVKERQDVGRRIKIKKMEMREREKEKHDKLIKTKAKLMRDK